MANPQCENGYTKIANEIMEKIISSSLNGCEIAVVLYIIRKTYGFNKKEDEISLSQFLKAIPVSKPSICKALNNLQLVNIIKLVKKGKSKNSSNLWLFNKNYDSWQLVKKSKLVKKKKSTSKENDTQLVKKTLHTKEILQNKYTKENISSEQSSQDEITVLNRFYDNGNKGLNFGSKTEREASKWLIKQYGLEKVLNTVDYAFSILGKPYAPTISTPYQLKTGMTKLLAYYKREQEPKRGVVPDFKF